ncbi:MAG: methyltransferase domain-containing protein [Pseudomonadota bacterium]
MLNELSRGTAIGCCALFVGGCAYLSSIGSDDLPDATLSGPLADETGPSDPIAMTDSEPALTMDKVIPPGAIEKAIADPTRLAEDLERDETRKPYDVMVFAGIEAGQTILELGAEGGYFTELFSRAVGPTGRIYMHNRPALNSVLDDEVNERLAGRLSNVTVVKTSFNRLPLAEGTADIVTWFQGPHELWFGADDGDALADPEAAFSAIARVLKPGGRLVVLDHRAAAGTPAASGGDTHRIDPQIVLDLAQEAGLVVAGESNILRSTSDDPTLDVLDDRVRGRTDQFLVAFRKP